ncbi:hypothetical protein G1H11_00150 [Phytoactinopolyspora alkaliphila]|uniref:Phage tail assembly protein n=1 Tax=Phytoactinopolyspora alkaliphila TaxID=1783498 RepID=A0A6N9YFG0_9ACTN|nr:hypothetical protein [Phytoactinopolyspora alkaliphila]NED93723.1 hypothetical protein [Phytoactinopolyspora alkaliphila]
MSLQTRFDFVLPRGYVDGNGTVHQQGTMRLATARDELEPLRDPLVDGPDDPRLTVLVLARVVERLGSLELVTPHEIEGLFAVDLAFLQDFYGVINFGGQDDYDALLSAQQELVSPVTVRTTSRSGVEATPDGAEPDTAATAATADSAALAASPARPSRPGRSAIEEISGAGR